MVADEAVEKYVYVDEDDFPKVDFESLQATNSDVVAWLYIPDTNVNFPVVKGPSNYTYLNLNYEGNYSISGSIFMDIACSSDFSDAETLLYGHNMHNGDTYR